MMDQGEYVFIVGSSRSGTTLLGSILVMSSQYAVYAAESQLPGICEVKYGPLSHTASREKFLRDWLNSRQFHRSGLTKDEFIKSCVNTSIADYVQMLGCFMGMIADKQGKKSWLDSTPSNIFSLDRIAGYFPNAKIIHVVRDGRAVAMSRAKLGWSGIGGGNYEKALRYSALMWRQSVEAGRKFSRLLPNRYIELHYEDLVKDPIGEMKRVCEFLHIAEIDSAYYKEDALKDSGVISALSAPNSPFGDMQSGISDTAVYRWKTALTERQIRLVEACCGPTLEKFGYPLLYDKDESFSIKLQACWSKFFLEFKTWVMRNTFVGRFSTTPLELNLD